MHDCPECGQACDCDGEDTWIGWPANINCEHKCDDQEDDLYPFNDEDDDDDLIGDEPEEEE